MKYIVIDNRIARDGDIIFDEEIQLSFGVSNYTVLIVVTVPDTIGEELGKPILANNGDMIYGFEAFKETNCTKKVAKYIASIGSDSIPRIGDFRIKSDRREATFAFDELASDKFPELQNHMEVTLRNGYNMVVFNGSLLGHTLEKTHCMVSIEDYTENGIHCTSHNHDIVEVKFNGKVIYGRIEDSKYWSASDKVMHEIDEYHRHKKELDACEVRIADLLELVEQANKLDINVCFKPEVKGVKLNG